MAPPDTRTAPRVAAPNVMVRVSTAQRFRAVYLKDLSEGGLFIKTDRPIPLGQKILVDLFPPGFTLPLRLPATVVRHATAPTAGMGVKFESMLPETSQALSTLVASYHTSVSAAAAPVNPVDASRDLEALTEQYSNLKTNFDVLQQDLLTERERREEASKRALQMVSELESAKTSPDTSSISSTQIEELKAALAAAQSQTRGCPGRA